MTDLYFPATIDGLTKVGRTKYLLRLQGQYHECGFCNATPVVAALVDPETDNSMAVCADHFQPIDAIECGLTVKRFTAVDVEGTKE